MLIKKPLDFLSAVALFIVVSPLLVIITLLLAASNSGTPFFIQPRVGKGNRIFNVIKFKTMNDQRDSHGALLPDDKRLTGLGRWIRKTSLDELPQLLNILTGDMSFIGPRPLLVEYLPLYSREQVRRHEVKPGITG